MTLFDHDYTKFPELTNTQLQVLRFTSPHAQIEEDFDATVVKVHDGDTITIRTGFRDFDFPLRLLKINAPELNEPGGKEAGEWLRNRIIDQKVRIMINRNNRVGKYGRLLGEIMHRGMNMNDAIVNAGHAKPFEQRNEGKIMSIGQIMLEGAVA